MGFIAGTVRYIKMKAACKNGEPDGTGQLMNEDATLLYEGNPFSRLLIIISIQIPKFHLNSFYSHTFHIRTYFHPTIQEEYNRFYLSL
jgi:hypothetical protein